jgi:phospholipase C
MWLPGASIWLASSEQRAQSGCGVIIDNVPYDSGYIQPIDFFGDGPRIPLIIVSEFTKGGHVNHASADHVSILKFIERNWHLKPLIARSRDNFPNPVSEADNPYVPLNSPAISDLFEMFRVGKARDGEGR